MDMPEKYTTLCSKQGRVECVSYPSRAYTLEAFCGRDEIPIEKKMYVYLPYGYDPDQTYDVLYLMHGGTEDEGYWFGLGRYDTQDTEKYTEAGNITRNLLDHLILEEKIRPLIVVTPSFCESVSEMMARPEYPQLYFDAVYHFWKDMKENIMPYIQSHYSTYAKSSSDGDMAAARAHYGFAGASQGSITGFTSVMAHLSDRFGYVGNFSAGIIRYAMEDGQMKTMLDEETLERVARSLNTGQAPLFWYNGCGDQDMMLKHHKETYEKLLQRCPAIREDNSTFVVHGGGQHTYSTWVLDLYEILIRFFG